jgi:hypothetical protein
MPFAERWLRKEAQKLNLEELNLWYNKLTVEHIKESNLLQNLNKLKKFFFKYQPKVMDHNELHKYKHD